MANINEDVLQKISELIPQAPGYWVDVISAKMKVTRASVYYYVNGQRGLRKGRHLEVLRLLIELIEKENKGIAKLIARMPPADELTNDETQTL